MFFAGWKKGCNFAIRFPVGESPWNVMQNISKQIYNIKNKNANNSAISSQRTSADGV